MDLIGTDHPESVQDAGLVTLYTATQDPPLLFSLTHSLARFMYFMYCEHYCNVAFIIVIID